MFGRLGIEGLDIVRRAANDGAAAERNASRFISGIGSIELSE